jgi:uncharacterized protein with HEPN domain
VTFSDRHFGWFEDIVDNINAIESYVDGMTLAQFAADSRTEDAVERCLQRLTEAVIRLQNNNAPLDQFSNIEWADIRNLGNHLRHGYDGLNRETIWNIIQDDLPALREAAQSALSQE